MAVLTAAVMIRFGFGVILSGTLLAVVEPQTPTAVLIATTAVGFLTIVVQQWFASAANKRAIQLIERQHQWDTQERATHAREMIEAQKAAAELQSRKAEAATAELKLLLERRAWDVRQLTESAQAELKELLLSNHELTQIAVDATTTIVQQLQIPE